MAIESKMRVSQDRWEYIRRGVRLVWEKLGMGKVDFFKTF